MGGSKMKKEKIIRIDSRKIFLTFGVFGVVWMGGWAWLVWVYVALAVSVYGRKMTPSAGYWRSAPKIGVAVLEGWKGQNGSTTTRNRESLLR